MRLSNLNPSVSAQRCRIALRPCPGIVMLGRDRCWNIHRRGWCIMKMRYFYLKFCTALALSLMVQQVTALAETLCKSDVSFKWKREQEELVEYWSTIQAKGADEKAAKDALGGLLDRERGQALKGCRERHEDVSGCMAGKLSSLRPTMSVMGYSERKSLEAAVSADCTGRQGKCGEVVLGEPKCAELVSGVENKAADDKGGKKDDKGKKK